MNKMGKTILGCLIALSMAGAANAANIAVTSNIATSTTWTANNVYNLVGQIYVLPGATLTIEAGTLIQSVPSDQGSLAITRGAKIFANGTESQPIIFTVTTDNMTTWHELPPNPGFSAGEWGNLTLMGNGLISASKQGTSHTVVTNLEADGVTVRTNTATPTGLNEKAMEGLTAAFPGDQNVLYGGADDNDDSGALHYVSSRYAGKVIGLGNELNGLSMGGIGRETDVDHIDIISPVDDAIETWGGTVNYKYVNIWYPGDDGFDFDEGWRGKAQFGLIVQGYSTDAVRGSGVSDNGFEMDGAEDSDAQPVSTAKIYNFTVIGQPLAARGGSAWRDNAHIQIRNSIFMDVGQQLVRFDNSDGDNAQGYGFNGTLPWTSCWTTSYTEGPNPTLASMMVNQGSFSPGAFNDPAVLYKTQTDGTLCELSDSVFFENLNAAAYTESDARGVTVSGMSNPAVHNVVASVSPIQAISRAGAVSKGGQTLLQVIGLDPRAANDAVSSFAAAPADGFFTPAPFRGGFSKDKNWACGWTAASAYGFFPNCGANPANPASTFSVNISTQTSFPTVSGVLYTVESSNDGYNWSPLTTVVGTGSTINYSDVTNFDSAKLYRAIAQ